MNTEEKLNLLKQVLTIVSGMLVGAGAITASQGQALVADIVAATGAITGLASIAWSVYSHWNQKKVPENAIVVGAK